MKLKDFRPKKDVNPMMMDPAMMKNQDMMQEPPNDAKNEKSETSKADKKEDKKKRKTVHRPKKGGKK